MKSHWTLVLMSAAVAAFFSGCTTTSPADPDAGPDSVGEGDELTAEEEPELLDVAGAKKLIAELEAQWPSHGPAHLQKPTSFEQAEAILKLDQASLFGAGIAFAATLEGVKALALEAQLELAWGEAYLTVLEIMLHLSEELEAEEARLVTLAAPTSEQSTSLTWIRDTLKQIDRLAQATELLSIKHLTRGASKANELIAQHSDNYLGYRVAADYFRMVGDWAQFEDMMTKIQARNPKSNGLVFQRGAAIHARSTDLEAASTLLRQALTNDPAFVRAQAHLVAIQPHIKEMHAEYQKLKKLSPDHQIVHIAGESIERAYERTVEP